jgi:internalin A
LIFFSYKKTKVVSFDTTFYCQLQMKYMLDKNVLPRTPEHIIKKIEAFKQSGENRLFLRDLEFIPSELLELEGLTELELIGGKISDLSLLKELEGLTMLRLSILDQVSDISVLGGLEGLTYLHLEALPQVSDISALGGLNGLTSLKLEGIEQVSDISVLGGLEGLTLLRLYALRQVSDISVLGGLEGLTSLRLSGLDQVSDISVLGGLQGLTSLELYSLKQVSDISVLGGLEGLTSLKLSSLDQVSDISVLGGLEGLTSLRLSHLAQVSDISVLGGLEGLTSLELSSLDQVSDISVLGGLQGLTSLRLHSLKQVSDVSFLKECRDLERLDTFNLPNITTPPLYTVKHGLPAIRDYFDEIARTGKKSFNELRVLVVGEGEAGKTSLVRKLINPDAAYPKKEDRTKGVDIEALIIEDFNKNGDLIVNLWDFGGQEWYYAPHQLFYGQKAMYIYVDKASKTDEPGSYPENQSYRKWFDTINVFGGESSPVVYVQNKISGRRKDVDYKSFRVLDGYKDKYELDYNNPPDLDTLKQEIKHQALTSLNCGEEFPMSWFEVKEELESFAKENDYISKKEFKKICKAKGIAEDDQIDNLIGLFNSQGHLFHFDFGSISRELYLNKDYLSKAMYKVIDDHEVTQNYGQFTKQRAKEIFLNTEYEYDEVVDLLQAIKLSYAVEGKEGVYVLPHLLPLQAKEEASLPEGTGIHLEQKYKQLPAEFFSKVIVRFHDEIYNQDWLSRFEGYFVADKCSKTIAHLKFDSRSNTLTMRVCGPKRMDYLEHFRILLADLCKKSGAGIELEHEKIPCICSECIDSPNPEMYKIENLKTGIKKGRKTIQCRVSYEDVNIGELLGEIIPPFDRSKFIEIIKLGEFDEAMSYLELHKVLEERDQTMLISNFNKVNGDYNSGTITREEYHVDIMRIIDSVLKRV